MSTAFQKMFLMSEEEMERMKSKQLKEYDPDLRSMTRLQDQATAILSKDDMNPDELLKLINMLQSRFNQIKNKDKAEPELAGVSKIMAEPDEPDEDEEEAPIPVQPMIGIAKRDHAKARSLIQLLSKDPHSLSVNDRMEIVVRDRPIPGSNIHDLLSDLFTTTKSRLARPRPFGFTSFVSALHDLNIPHTLISNPKYIKELSGSSSSSSHSLSINKARKSLQRKIPASARILKLYPSV
jgi:hypothetical protein